MDGKKDWKQLWLKYDRKADAENGKFFEKVALEGFDAADRVVKSALCELRQGAEGMLGVTPALQEGMPCTLLLKKAPGKSEGYALKEENGRITLKAADEKGLLYGAFHLLRLVSMEKSLTGVDKTETDRAPHTFIVAFTS